LRVLLQGGDQMGNLTLTRFFTIHGFILPGLVVLLTVVHLYLFRRHGVTPPLWRSPGQLKAAEEPFWPKQALKDGVLALAFLIGLGVWAYWRPAPLEERADPSKLYEARPEWYFMFLFQLLSYFKGPYEIVGTFILPLLFFLILFFWPLLDRNPHRSPLRRPFAMGALTLGTAGLIGLTIFAIATDVRMHEPVQAVAAAPPPAEPAGPIQRLDVPRLYETHCQACHGVDGSGQAARERMPDIPDFTSLSWQAAHPEVEIAHRIMDGSGKFMLPFRDKLTKDENLALAIYVRAFSVEFNRPGPPVAGKEPPKEPPKEPTPLPPSGLPAEELYRTQLCMSCHDRDGSGKVVRSAMPKIPDFKEEDWQKAHADDAALARSIREGVKGTFMPATKDRLAAEDVDKLVAFVRSFKERTVVKEEPKEPPKPPDAPKIDVIPPKPPSKPPGPSDEERAAKVRVASVIYREYCVNCHGADGRGSSLKAVMPDLPDFTSTAWQDARKNFDLKAGILNGKGRQMPAFADRVKDDQAGALVAYVRAFGPERPPGEEPPPGDFEERYRRLQDEWDALQKQLDELSKQPKKP
jgi:mono/diheme cytochrome c family protein